MREELNLKISQFVDGELEAAESLKLLKAMDKEPELSNLYRRYDAISQAMKSDVFVLSRGDFVEAVAARIEGEPVVIAPGRRMLRPHLKAFTAVAASVAVVSVLIAGSIQFRVRPMVNELSMQQASAPFLLASTPSRSRDARFKEYLEAHDATFYADKYAVAQGLGHVVKYERR